MAITITPRVTAATAISTGSMEITGSSGLTIDPSGGSDDSKILFQLQNADHFTLGVDQSVTNDPLTLVRGTDLAANKVWSVADNADTFLIHSTSTFSGDITVTQSGASQIEVVSTGNDAYLILNSNTDEGQDSEVIFESGGTARGRIEYNHHATANSQLMSFFTADNAVETLKLQGNLATFGTAVNINVANEDLPLLTFEADMGTNNNRTLIISTPATDSASEPFRINTGNSLSFEIDGTERIKLDSSGNTNFVGALTVGVDDTGHDVKFFGAATGKYMLWDESEDYLFFPDNTKAVFGTGADLQIYHDANDSYIDDAGTGILFLRGNSAVKLSKYTGEALIDANADGSVVLYYDDSPKLATHTSGVEITGSLEVATIDYTDGDLAMTIADGGGVTFAGTASALTHPAAVIDIKPSFTGASGSSTGIQLHPTFTAKNSDVHFGTHIKYTYNESGETQPSARAVWLEDSAVTGTVTSMVGLWIDNFNSGDSGSGTSLYIEGGGTYALHVDSGVTRIDGAMTTYGDINVRGTTPSIILGDGGDEDTFIVFDADHDFYMGSGDTENAFNFGSGITMGSEMIWQAGVNTFYFVASSGVYVKNDVNFYWGTGADYKMEYESVNARWVMWTNDTNGAGGNEDIIRIEDGQKSIDANTTWDENIFDIYDDAILLASSISPTANAYDFGKGVFKRGKEALIEAGVLKRYKDDGWVGYNDQRMAALLAGGIYQTRWMVDEMKEKISELENKVKALGG